MAQGKLPIGMVVIFGTDPELYKIKEIHEYRYICESIVSGNLSNFNKNHVRPYYVQSGDEVEVLLNFGEIRHLKIINIELGASGIVIVSYEEINRAYDSIAYLRDFNRIYVKHLITQRI